MKPGIPADYITGEKRYLTAITLLITAIFLTGFISRVVLDKRTEAWESYRQQLSQQIEKEFQEEFRERETALTEEKARIKFAVAGSDKKTDLTPVNLSKILSVYQSGNYELFIFDEKFSPLYFNRDYIFGKNTPADLIKSTQRAGVFFYENPFAAYLIAEDSLETKKGKVFILLADPVNRKIEVRGSVRNPILGARTEKSMSLKFTFHYSSAAMLSKDGRDHNIHIKNAKGEIIGYATFTKPGLRNFLETAQNPVSVAQAIMVLLVMILIPFSLKRDLSRIKYRYLRTLFLIFYLVMIRIVIYMMDFTVYIFPDALTDPAKFASGFGYGIVKSPIDFTLTVLFFFVICFLVFREAYRSDGIRKINVFRFAGFVLFLIPVYYLLIRAYSASVKSIIFDSSIRYFREPDIFPALPTALMNFAALFLSLSFYLLLVSILILIFSRFVSAKKRKNIFVMIMGLIISLGLGYAFIVYQRQPLINPQVIFIIILFTYILLYLILCEKRHIPGVLFTAGIFSAITGVAMLNFFNSDLERESLKTTAAEINRRSENLIYFLLNQSLADIAASQDVRNALAGNGIDANRAAFSAWSSSSLRKEELNSSVTLLNNKKKAVGGFTMNLPPENLYPPVFRPMEIQEMVVLKLEVKGGVSYFSGIVPVHLNGEPVGYVIASVGYNRDMVVNESFPEILLPAADKLNSVIDHQVLNIVIYDSVDAKTLKGSFYPTGEQTRELLESRFSDYGELWKTFEYNDEKYLFYFLKVGDKERMRIISAGIKERELSWSLFNFFKLFILQAFYILVFFIIYQVIKFFISLEFKISYRSQLFVSFLFIALLPLIALAVYNRMNEQEKSFMMLKNGLREKAMLVEKHITQQLPNNKNKKPETAFANAAAELGITFYVFQNPVLVYTPAVNLAGAGVIQPILNPVVGEQLFITGANESYHKDYILGSGSYTFYRKINLSGKEYALGVSEALNPVNVVTTILEIDVFVIGIYSFAIVIIILLSGFLSNRISQPIIKLTKATRSIAHGDFNVSLENSQRGEIGELIEGFRFMTGEIRRTQKELAEQEREMAWREIAKQVAHEIKNPLTPMKLSIQQLIASHRDGAPNFDELFSKITNTVLNQIDILNQIAGEFSRFAKMPGSKTETVDLINIIKDVIALYTDEKIKLTLRSSLSQANVLADIPQIRRMLINFIRNSIQAGAKEISFNLDQDDNVFSMRILDNGSGIPEENKEKIFNKNFTTKDSGMGLGLKLSRRYIESLGGTIILVSSGDGATVFEVKIPALISSE